MLESFIEQTSLLSNYTFHTFCSNFPKDFDPASTFPITKFLVSPFTKHINMLKKKPVRLQET